MKRRTYFILLFAAALIAILAGCSAGDSSGQEPSSALTVTKGEETLKVYFLDVGKGDSALIGIPGGYWAMIDTGPKGGFMEIGRQLFLSGVQKLSAIFLTHGHSDHIGGLDNVLGMAKCEALYTNGDAMGEKRIVEAADNGTPVKLMKAGDKTQIGDAVFTVLGPVQYYEEENDNSLVIMLEYKDVKLLFAADQLLTAERDIMGLGGALDADVLKAAHHGEDDATSLEFIKAVSPLYAVITTDLENPPSKQVINSITIAGGQPFVLGETGTMLFESDGSQSSMSRLPVPETAVPDVRVDAFDVSAEFVRIANRSGAEVDIAGWCIYSEKGKEAFFFPKGTKLAPGGSISVLSGGAAQTQSEGLVWTTEKVWSKKDTCTLYDNWGREVSKG